MWTSQISNYKTRTSTLSAKYRTSSHTHRIPADFFNVLGSSVSLLHVTHFSTLWRGENLLEPASCKIIWTQMIAYAWCLPRHLALPLLKCFLLCSSLNIVCLISPFSLQGPHVFASRPNHLYYYPQFLHIFYYWLCEIEDEGQIVSRSLSPAYLSYAFW